MNAGDYFPRVTRPRRQADHSFPPNAEIKNSKAILALPLYAFRSCTGTALPLQFKNHRQTQPNAHLVQVDTDVEVWIGYVKYVIG
jgi:hypothetical protein